MNKESAIEAVEKLREQMHDDIDLKCDNLIERIKNGESLDESNDFIERTLLLNSMSAFFKGTKISAVRFSDGREEKVNKWKDAVKIILQDCNSDEKMHFALTNICGTVFGKTRTLFDKTPDEMIAPIKIDEGMYLETKFDVEALLNVLKNRILDFVGYDYSGISIKYKEPIIITNQITDEKTVESVGFTMGGM